MSERSWGTVREDYSPDGCAWDYFPHDLARSRAYRWGEDAIAGLCDRYQLLVFGLALWNGRDPILKERFFGLSNPEGNHGEDVKEYWFFLDCTPTHSYMRMLYKYPQNSFPYGQLVRANAERRRNFEYELLDTGIFDEDRYFDVFIQYAKNSPEDVCIRIEAVNRGPEPAELHLLPHLWFRNTWSWTQQAEPKPVIRCLGIESGIVLIADDPRPFPLKNLQFPYALGKQYLQAPSGGEALFTDNETNWDRVPGGHGRRHPFVKDAFHRYIINSEDCINPQQTGTKACLHYKQIVPAGESWVMHLRLCDRMPDERALAEVESIVEKRKWEADEFYETIHPRMPLTKKRTYNDRRSQGCFGAVKSTCSM